jgi:hypothetical protein
MVVRCECCVLSGRGLCDRLITRPEESYRLWCFLVCELGISRTRRLKLVRVVNYYYLAGCTMFPHLPAPIDNYNIFFLHLLLSKGCKCWIEEEVGSF